MTDRLPVALCALICCLPAWSAPVDEARLAALEQEPGSWLTHGRNYAETRESQLTGINTDNVSRLGLAWYFEPGTKRGLEATPLMIDGVLFTTGTWSRVYALDARTGALLWTFDPQVPRAWGQNACCDVVNRGVAAWGDNVYVGTIDGRLVALNRETGAPVWETLTIDPQRPYTITGAPRVVKGKVIIGNGGSEYGVRGYVSAYDAGTGALSWRFLHRAGQSRRAVRERRHGHGRPHLVGRPLVGGGRRRHGLGFHGLRPGAGSALHRRG